MSRFPRNYIKTNFFHIITQGINKSYIFERSRDIKYYIKIMHQLSQEHNVEILAYCVMNNHTHMLVKTMQIEDLSKYMQRLNTKYAKYYNNKYNRVGYVFRNRYKSEGIYDENYLYNCMRYIYNNPVKAGICKEAKEYPYSNYKEFNSEINKEIREEINDEYKFMDIVEDNPVECKDIVRRFLDKNKINLNDLKKNRKKLKELIIILKEDYDISLRRIAEELKINRECLRKIYSK